MNGLGSERWGDGRRGKRCRRMMCGGREVTRAVGMIGAAIGSLAGGAVNPPWPPLRKGGKGGAAVSLERGRSSGLLAGGAVNSAWHWVVEKWGVLANSEVDDSAFSVARRFCDGGRRDGPPLAPPS